MQHRYPELNICGTQHGYFDEDQTDQVIDQINRANPSVLLVAMGAPLQELWIAKHREKLQVKVAMGVGGLFDFYAGQVARAPLWLREIGLEWCWRILQEPGRMWRRYIIGNPLFLYRVWRYGKRNKAQNKRPSGGHDESAISAGNWYVRTWLRRILWSQSSILQRILKRLLDITVASVGLILLSPLLALVAIAIRLESSGPAFFQQIRIGRAGQEFKFLKFRSMYIDAEQRRAELLNANEMAGGVLFKLRDDPRITRVGGFIRRTSIDELPQLWNVLRGDMSLVGPRPCLPSEASEYSVIDRLRLDAEPGITCTWQVSGRSDIPFAQQVEMDLEYINQSNWKKDFILLVKTIPAVISGRGAY
jgi:lipopolysaccharide/colanic/teichoic acid biosynthesis glycosyltransferase